MPLHPKIRHQFNLIPLDSTDEHSLYAPWNMLLNYLFPMTDGWVVTPQPRPRPANNRESIDSGIYYNILRDNIPVLFVEVKCRSALTDLSARGDADAQMRRRFVQLYSKAPKTLRGISAFGSRLCLYTLEKRVNQILPPQVPNSETFIIDVAPQDRWDIDIMSDAGYNKVVELVNECMEVVEEIEAPV